MSENSVQKLIEEIAQIAEKYDVVSRCVLDIRRLKERYKTEAFGRGYEIVFGTFYEHDGSDINEPFKFGPKE